MSDSPQLQALLAEQVAYYCARAAEYDATTGLAPHAQARLERALADFDPRGRVLELACGTGQWTQRLAATATQLTAVDASAEMLAINRARVKHQNIEYIQADLFAGWGPPREDYDVVFFSAWLSHVPRQLLPDLWRMVARALKPAGRVFVIDELAAHAAPEEALAQAPAPAVRRRLRSGASYRAVKVFYEPDELRRTAALAGLALEVHPADERFFYATGTRACAGPIGLDTVKSRGSSSRQEGI